MRGRGSRLSATLLLPAVLLSSVVLMRTPVSGLYFPQSELSLRLPYPPRISQEGKLATEVRLLRPRTLRNDSSEPTDADYRVHVPQGDIASVDGQTGDVLLHGLPDGGVSSTIVVMAREKDSNEAILEIKVHPIRVSGKEINCRDYIEDMCFWNTSTYRVYENQPVTMIGSFGPEVYKQICPSYRISRYELLNGTKYFHLVENKLYANASLDRDSTASEGSAGPGPGPRLLLDVRCVVWEEKTGIQHAPTRRIAVNVLDQDDNPPVMQGNSSIEITLRDFTIGEKLLDGHIIKDADEKNSNRYEVEILGDTENALRLDTLLIDLSKDPPSTAIVTSIFSRTTLLPRSPYRVVLRVKDASLLPGHGEDTVNLTLSFYGPEHRTTTTTVPSVPTKQLQLSYPSTVKIPRISPRFFRVARPSVEPHRAISFAINGSEAFSVTPRGGIVYVADQNLLRSEPQIVSLKLKWSGAVSWKTIRVNLSNVTASRVEACEEPESGAHSCANAETREKCESSCGVASGTFSKGNFRALCVWRLNKRSNASRMSDQYPTCSPDLAYCPDNKCDDLEELDLRICPQDCTLDSDVHFGHTVAGERGIKSGIGTCACNDMLQCTCNVDRFRRGNDNPGGGGRAGGARGGGAAGGNKEGKDGAGKLGERQDELLEVVSGARKASSGPCGPACMIGLIGAFFGLVVVVGSLVMWRYRRATKGARRECKRRVDGDSNGVAILPSDYIDRGDGLLIGLDTFTAANRHLLLPKPCPPDPKWEFPRSRLTIEQILGEGEFGRVLRAKAVDIGGTVGPTTVAVKTLKENACASELADLLSEYQLLKEAQHPNVIRLLGACTTPGAPVYLIIEFAEFGSLRNYLRRSRHLDSEGRRPCSTSLRSSSANNLAEEPPRNPADESASTGVYTVTPRDILSFAWQISKGMGYLADIKLVHRDLAARNVLLATGKVCKISDFGLTRDVYEDDAYLKRSKGRVPVKWMAPESLADHVYTSKSDVWSFGVLLWELVTLGASPYPGVDVHNLYNLLKAGYRMERPGNCSQQLYKLMVSCWHQEPGMRPSFKELTGHWERMLEDGVEYLDLNPRTVHNQAYFASLHALDSPTSSGNEEPSENTAIPRTDGVNYLGKPSTDTVTKCDKVDKLQTLWQQPVASFPDEPIKMGYVNDRPSGLNANHYESPIKFRKSSLVSNSENELQQRNPRQDRPQSYIDMEGKKPSETGDLLVFGSMDGREGGERRDEEDKGN